MMRRLLALACVLGAAGWVTSIASAAVQPSHTCANNASVSIVHGITVSGGKATVDYNVPAGCGSIELSLVSYQAPSANYDPATADQEVLYKSVTQTVPEGNGTLTVDVPSCYFQVDFVYGQPIEHLGPAGSDNFYNNSHESRLIQGLMGGTSACQIMQPPVCPSAANTQVTPMGQTTFAGNVATISFTVAAGCKDVKLSFVSYKAPSNVYTAEEANQQVLFKYVTQTFQAGPGQMSVEVPNCYFQLDFVYGEHLDTLGPVGTDNFYNNSKEQRLIRGQMGGTEKCAPEQKPADQPPAEQPPAEQPPAQQPPVQQEQPVVQQPVVQQEQPVTQQPVVVVQQPAAPVVQPTTTPPVTSGVAGVTKTIAKKPTVKKKVVKHAKPKVKKVTKHAVAAKAVVRHAGFTG